MWEKLIGATCPSCAEHPRTGATSCVVMADCMPDVAILPISRPTPRTMAIPLCSSLRGDVMVPGHLEPTMRNGGKRNSFNQHRLQTTPAVILEYCAQNHVCPMDKTSRYSRQSSLDPSGLGSHSLKALGQLSKHKLESSMNMNNTCCT